MPPGDAIKITEHDRVEFRELKVHRQVGKDPLLTCPDLGHYMEVEEDTLKAIDALSSSSSVGAAEEWLAEQTGERYDLTALAEILLKKGFVARINGRDVESDAPKGKGRTLFSFVPPTIARWVRHPVVVALALFLTLQYALSLALGVVAPPRFSDAALTPRPLLNISLVMGGMLAMAFLHELAHYFTARSYGLDPKIALSHRFYMAVLTTDVTEAWTLPKRPQLAIFSAGILFNLSVMGIAGLFLGFHGAGVVAMSDASERALRFLVLINGFPLIFQLFLVARTDLYYILQAITGDRNLSRDSLSYVGMRAARVWKLLLRKPRAACVDCAGACFDTEPFCVRCGAVRTVADPNRYPFRYERRHALAAFGLLSAVGFVVMFPLIALMFVRIFFMGAQIAVLAPLFLDGREWVLLGESIAALVFFGFILVFVASRILQFLLLPMRFGWQAVLQRFPMLPTPVKPVVVRIQLSLVAWRASRISRVLKRVFADNGQANLYQPRWAQANDPARSENP